MTQVAEHVLEEYRTLAWEAEHTCVLRWHHTTLMHAAHAPHTQTHTHNTAANVMYRRTINELDVHHRGQVSVCAACAYCLLGCTS